MQPPSVLIVKSSSIKPEKRPKTARSSAKASKERVTKKTERLFRAQLEELTIQHDELMASVNGLEKTLKEQGLLSKAYLEYVDSDEE